MLVTDYNNIPIGWYSWLFPDKDLQNPHYGVHVHEMAIAALDKKKCCPQEQG